MSKAEADIKPRTVVPRRTPAEELRRDASSKAALRSSNAAQAAVASFLLDKQPKQPDPSDALTDTKSKLVAPRKLVLSAKQRKMLQVKDNKQPSATVAAIFGHDILQISDTDYDAIIPEKNPSALSSPSSSQSRSRHAALAKRLDADE
jgi:hypothetical protein